MPIDIKDVPVKIADVPVNIWRYTTMIFRSHVLPIFLLACYRSTISLSYLTLDWNGGVRSKRWTEPWRPLIVVFHHCTQRRCRDRAQEPSACKADEANACNAADTSSANPDHLKYCKRTKIQHNTFHATYKHSITLMFEQVTFVRVSLWACMCACVSVYVLMCAYVFVRAMSLKATTG